MTTIATPQPAPPLTTLARGHRFVEAPRIADDGTLWFSDLLAGGAWCQLPGGPAVHVAADRQWIGGIALCADGTAIVSGRGGLARLDPADGVATPLSLAIATPFELCVNDIEAMPDGSLIGGTIDFAAIMSGQRPAPGHLFHRAPDGRVTILRRDVVASNGLGRSPCGTWLYHSETGRGIWRYPLGADGLAGAGTLFAAMTDSDGLAIDSAGGIWVAGWESAELRRYAPDGTLTQHLRLPVANVVSVAFGGPDLGRLYITTGGTDAGVLTMPVAVPGQRDAHARIDGPEG